jgi:hypothetical protein
MADDDQQPEPVETTDEPAQPDDVESLRAALAKANKDAERHRKRNKDLEPLAAKAQELEDRNKTETEKLTERLNAAEKRALDAARYEVALDKGLTRSQAKRLIGSTPEELAADADELLSDLGAADKPNPTRKPREQLKPGNSDADAPPDEADVRKLGARMFTS